MKAGRLLIAVSVVASALAPLGSSTADPPYLSLVGALHEHSGYSDGWPGSTPADYYASGKAFGLDFLAGSEHSDNSQIPAVFSEYCLTPEDAAKCAIADDDNPVNSFRKWDATLDYARAATDAGFTGFRGFEWTSDVFGHINVFFSAHDWNAKEDGGYGATTKTFYTWFGLPHEVGGGDDGLAVFNHPGDKCLLGRTDATCDWNHFEYVPEADDRMVGIELYNGHDTYGSYYVEALDKGWHLGAVGAEDIGHSKSDDWGGPGWAKTVILATDRSEAAIRAAMLARRFYAVRARDIRLDFSVDGEGMGARIARAPGDSLPVHASVNRSGATIELVTSGGTVVATSVGPVLDAVVSASAAQRYYFARVIEGGKAVAFSSPVWVTQKAGPAVGEWLAGDLHVHTCYSHDAWCPPDDNNTGPDDFYTLSGSVEERFIEAAARGLDYLAITDHHSDGNPGDSGARSIEDPGFGTHGVIGVPGYENSIHGHAQMLGATHVISAGDGGATAVNLMAGLLRAKGGVFQANHPADGLRDAPFACGDTGKLHWGYGYDVRPDTIEVWNISQQLQPPVPAGTSNEDAARFWECWLDRGAHVGATGGSDSHWLSTAAVQGPGNPTTWVFARERSARGVLEALREGRTTVSMLPPVFGAPRLILEADADGDGVFESMVGDTVPPGTPMRVRVDNLPVGGLVDVRANSATIVNGAPLVPGGEVRFTAPAEAGWVRAILRAPDATDERGVTCDGVVGQNTTYCRNRVAVTALTSAIYLG
ncbi:MAG: CehA/McbA family metallohydrolase [Acidobacteria bacterium]|nr:CehA/McbA family metallohydrolase [Acidobacteriota bacterium]